MEHQEKPPGFEHYLSNFGAVLYDSNCGEPVAWGYKIIHHLGEDLFRKLGEFGLLECLDMGSWVLVTKVLTREEAIELYGAITEEVFGPRGGWKSVTFGNKRFISRYLKSIKE